MPYIHFTEEQKLRASEVDLVEFLRHQGEKLIRSGPEYRLASDHSITVQGNEWYDHAIKEGGGPISFVQQFYNLSYPEAITCLLGGEQGIVCWCDKEGLPFLTYTAEELQEVKGNFTGSSFVREKTGIDNVCERAALKACGGKGKLITPKYAENGMTIAVAKREWEVRFDEE